MGIFKSDGSSSGCPALPQPLTEHGSAYQIMFYITIAGIALTAIFSLSLIFMHLTRYIAPKEQRQIVRLVFAPVVIAFMSIISLISYTAARYVAELGDLYDAFALAGLYLLFVQFSIPSGTSGPELFDNMDQNSGSSKNPRKADWPQKTWAMVFQFPVVMPILFIVEEASLGAGAFCSNTMSPKHANFWVTVIKIISAFLAISNVLKYYKSMKGSIRKSRPVAKMVCFKLVLGLSVVQTFVINILITTKAIKPSGTFSYGDLRYGIPAVLSSIEAIIISAANWYACSPAEYRRSAQQPLGFFHACLDALNPLDLLQGIVRGVMIFVGKGGNTAPYSDSGYVGIGQVYRMDSTNSMERASASLYQNARGVSPLPAARLYGGVGVGVGAGSEGEAAPPMYGKQ